MPGHSIWDNDAVPYINTNQKGAPASVISYVAFNGSQFEKGGHYSGIPENLQAIIDH